MAGIRSTQYPGRWNVPDSNSPQGSAKNRTSPTSNDGSYLDQVWFNDMDSLHQALFIASGITPNGTQDVGTASQIFDALLNNRWSAIGNYSAGTIVTASDGFQYYCKSGNGRDSLVLDPSSVSDRNVWVRYPYISGSNSNGDYRVNFDDSIEQWGKTPQLNPQGLANVTFPIPFTGSESSISITFGDTSSPGFVAGVSVFGSGSVSLSGFEAMGVNATSSTPAVNDSSFYYARSKGL